MSVDPRDELDHFAGPSSAWSETWEWRLATPDLGMAVAVAIVRRPAEGQMSYRAAMLSRSRPLVVLCEHELTPPRTGLEVRGSGIWADHVCEDPHEHWTLGLEAFALALDDPDDLVTRGRGLPVPFGLDLEWEADGEPVVCDNQYDRGYLAAGSMHGDVLIADEAIAVEGHGVRIHRWGVGPPLPVWWSLAAEVGVGEPPWGSAFDETACVAVPDSVGQVAELACGTTVGSDGVTGPAWWSSVVGE